MQVIFQRIKQFFHSQFWQSLKARLTLAAIAVLYLAIVPGDTPGGNSRSERVVAFAKEYLFNYVSWEAEALSAKFMQQQAGLASYMAEAKRSQYVVEYFELVRQLESIEGQIEALRARITPSDRNNVAPELEQKRSELQNSVNDKLPLVEAIIEEQVASVLRDEGFAVAGAVLPPVSAHITALPMLLVVSPRDAIRFDTTVNLVHIDTETMEQLEGQIDHSLNISSLVVPIGGLSLYPSMTLRTSNVFFAFEVTAHEWTHHYLYFFPLGLDYAPAGDARTINESTASLLGEEISRKVILRFYSDYQSIIDQLPPLTKTTPSPKSNPDKPPEFDAGAVLNETRITVDSLLAAGKIEEAEAYMETQRQLFVQNGYLIRKMNQAYFAFYGGYQSPTGGAGGADPIGPTIAEIRELSGSLQSWLETMRSITTREQLLAARDNLRDNS